MPTTNEPVAQPASLWHNRNYLLLWSGQIVSSIGTQVSDIAFPFLVLALTNSPAQAGFVGAAGTLPYFIFSLPAGALIDRWDRTRYQPRQHPPGLRHRPPDAATTLPRLAYRGHALRLLQHCRGRLPATGGAEGRLANGCRTN